MGSMKKLLLTFAFACTALILNGCTNTDDMTQTDKITLHTNQGDMTLKLYPEQAPKAVENFIGLGKSGKYDGVTFHRVIEGFMIQGGDYENGNGTGGQSIWGAPFEDEFSADLSNVRGALSMANAGPGTNGSQFFIVHQDAVFLDGRHTVFGQIESGMEVVDAIATVDTDRFDAPLEAVVIERVSFPK